VILFNWAKMYAATSGDSSSIVTLLAYLTYPTLPRNRYDSIYRLSQQDWSGNSFILHPEKIISNRSKFGDNELAQYVALASFRSYAEYEATTKRSLNLFLAPIPTEIIDNNRLLSRIEDEIFFCWEEVTH
jgi:hypothetical protein